jgi:PAT family beta-lactamase induction signal transducer AmpG
MTEQKKMTLKEALFNKKMLICMFNGFAAGLPIYFIISFVPAWLRSEKVDLKTIGFFGFVLLPYAYKFLWAPVLDRYVPPFLGRRRGWMLITQIFIMISMLSMAFMNPSENINLIMYAGLGIAFFSATQDIVLDAYRRELLEDNELGLGNTYYANVYRLAQFVPGSLGLILAAYMPWNLVIVVISLFMLIGVFQSFWINEIETEVEPPKTMREAVIEPFKEFFQRDGFKSGLLILSFIFFYKFGDTVATSLITPFYLDVGFSTQEIGLVVKTVAFWAMFVGGFAGGIYMFKAGINKSLWVFGFIQLVSILGFAVLSEVGKDLWVLGGVVAFEYLGVGLGSAALMAYIAKSTNKNFTGTQLALLTSLFAVPKAFAGIVSGIMVEGITAKDGLYYSIFGEISGIGYTKFFIFCSFLALPGMFLLLWVAPWNKSDEVTE